ncbi:hypothetical protein FIV42_00875 [Persicimonas caeni]|uniref:HEAT repeat domain-containing protein n=1 Tax=Persicimonas caeni TaxID=2292766 RepID=A0A4Y6PMT1_PERCE|nr:hypothetical protein [Persicimonas caeni]QDG49337.1 hypothetical protein FIV42_00875 [Persicimonas caeni]QED30558.1 hypothetical protein FRD00_00870 [Persicimonas caeni]
MMTIQTKWLLAVAGVACVGGAGAWLYYAAPSTQSDAAVERAEHAHLVEGVRASGERARGCAFTPGVQLAYDLVSEDKADLDLSGLGVNVPVQAGTDLRATTRARLELRALSTDPEGSVLLGRFASIEADTIVEDAELRAPFLVRVGPDCGIDGFAHRKGMDAGYARVQQALVHELGWLWPADGKGSLGGRGANGSFVATVTQTQKNGEPALAQAITSFEPWTQGAGSVARVTDSHQLVVPGDVAWFESLEARASYEGAHSRVQHTTRATYADDDVTTLDDAPTAESAYVWADLLPQMIPLQERQPPSKAELAALAEARKLTVDQAVDQYVARATSDEVGIKDTWPPLRTFLEAKPEAANAVIDKMKRGELPAEATMGAYIALGNARTPQAKAALEGVMRDENAPTIERSRAVLALIDRSDVGVELASYLSGRSNALASGKTKGERVMARQSLLALGAMSGRKPHDQDIKQAALSQIATLLEEVRGKSAAYQRPVFGALANVGEPDSLRLVAHIPEHADPRVREVAAIVFRRMPPAATADFTARWLAKETDANVLRKLWHTVELQTFDAREMTSREVLEYAVRDLRKKPGPITRKSLIRLLGRAKAQMENDELGIEDAFAELLPYEFEQKTGLHRMMHEHIEPERRDQIYLEVAQRLNAHSSEAGPTGDKTTPGDIPLPAFDSGAGETAR